MPAELPQTILEARGWTRVGVERLGLEYDGRRVVIPVRDQSGELIGRLRYLPGAGDGARKMIADAGVTRELFPPPEDVGEGEHAGTLWIVEGEPDAVRLWSIGLAAVAVPGVKGWRSEWAARFSGRDWRVYVVFDADDEGHAAAERVASELVEQGVDARLVDLERGGRATHKGYDLTDYLAGVSPLVAGAMLDALSDTAELVAHESPRLLLPLHELRARHEAEDEVDWIWDQLVAPGYLTRVDGRPKVAGKSTLLFALCAAIRNGQPFLGFDTRPATVAYCSEQRWRALHAKLILPYGAPPYMHLYHDEPLTLAELVPRLVDEVEQLGVELVVIDTASKWLRLPQGGRFDPDVMGQQMALLEGLAQRVAVVVADYTKKGEAPRGEGTLGATEQTGRADILLELKRPDSSLPTVRRLEVTGRSDAPEEIDYAMGEHGVLEPVDVDELVATDLRSLLLSELRRLASNGEPSLSASELATLVKKRKSNVLDELKRLRDERLVTTLGAGPTQVWVPVDENGSEDPEPVPTPLFGSVPESVPGGTDRGARVD